MANMYTIHKKLGSTVCRRCIAAYFNVAIEPPDCKYALYPDKCSACGKTRNIVEGLTASGKRKLLFK